MIIDFDDFFEMKAFVLLQELKSINPLLKVTLFSIPGKNTPSFFEKVAQEDWIELALHGWIHSYKECLNWKAKDVIDYISLINREYPGIFVKGFKPPHWAINREAIDTFLKEGYWLSLHPESDDYKELIDKKAPVYRFTEETRHGHIEWGPYSLYNNFDYWKEMIKKARTFKFISEVVNDKDKK